MNCKQIYTKCCYCIIQLTIFHVKKKKQKPKHVQILKSWEMPVNAQAENL